MILVENEFRVKVVKKTGRIPEGASIVVKYETRKKYIGLWPNGPVTFNVTILKKHCVKE